MKKQILSALVISASLFFSITSCTKKAETPNENQAVQEQAVVNDDPLSRACPTNVFALVLSGAAGTPVPAGLQSFIYRVNLCTAPVGYLYVSQIKIGITPVTCVTGLCDMPGVPGFAWAVTGANSNFPQRLLRVNIATGAAFIAVTTQYPLQDIENISTAGFVAIKEATSQLVRVNVTTGACPLFAPLGPTNQYNGLTVVGNKLHAISGLTNLICTPRTGDIFEYTFAGGPYVGKYSYKNPTTTPSWTMKELGFYFDACCAKRWVVGSSSGILSRNLDITACTPPSPLFLRNVGYVYDFMAKP